MDQGSASCFLPLKTLNCIRAISRLMSTRRDFIKQAAAVTVTALAGHSILSPASAEAKKKALGANDKIHIGVIGVNSRGKALATNFSKMPGCEVGFLCDCDSDALKRCQESVSKVTGKTPKGRRTYVGSWRTRTSMPL